MFDIIQISIQSLKLSNSHSSCCIRYSHNKISNTNLITEALKQMNHLILGSGTAVSMSWTAWSWRSCTNRIPAIRLKWMPSGSSSPDLSSKICKFGGRFDIICWRACKTTGLNLGNHVGLFLTMGGERKNLTVGYDWANANTPLGPPKICINVWFNAASPPFPSSPVLFLPYLPSPPLPLLSSFLPLPPLSWMFFTILQVREERGGIASSFLPNL